MTSLWLENTSAGPEPVAPTTIGGRYDHVVVGGGITGLTTALLLARAGRSVAVIEARYIGAGATGNTTGKVSLLQGTRLSTIGRHHDVSAMESYVAANRAALDWLGEYCRGRDLDYQEHAAVTFATTPAGAQAVDSEYEACTRVGLPVERTDCPELPFTTHAGVRLDHQAQIDPMVTLRAMVADLATLGADVYENVRVTGVRPRSHGHTVATSVGDLTAKSVVIATGTPFLDRGGFFARLRPRRSYAASFQVGGPIPQDMYLGADDPTVSLRTAPRADGEQLLVGGFGHEVGRASSERRYVDDLLAWTAKWFPDARLTARWAAQDYLSIDELPYVGPLLPGIDVHVATGFAKWGMTNGVAAALALAARLSGAPAPSWAETFQPWRRAQVAATPTALSTNLAVGKELAEGYLRLLRPADPEPPEGQGTVGRVGMGPRGVCTVDGERSSVVPICTHLYGVLEWNDADCSWDCPLHGSRFDPHGNILEGPATRKLPKG
ncbi:FAD-dependent oxidoreductase [Gordonia sp. DT30]|uniref:FAD-dependent oxidoreductase n=1 Tax=unclassified Gordonia (in: high G+C Gram-positive bacteria) TaxID=2657482 RepID=UPI003CF7E031